MSATNTNTKKNYKAELPALESFQAEYYFQNDSVELEARFFPPHVHDCLEIYVLLEGDASFMVENTLYKLRAGDAVVTKPNEMHTCVLDAKSPHKQLCFWFTPTSKFLFSPFLSHEYGKNNVLSPNEADKERLLQIYGELQRVSETGNKRRQFFLFMEMLALFSKNMELPQAEIHEHIPDLLINILDDIHENFTQINTLDYFTEKYLISKSTLGRLFKSYLHTTPKLYLETKRLAYSRQLLKEGQSVFQACTTAGFPDYSNYVQLFKRRFGLTPKKYRDG